MNFAKQQETNLKITGQTLARTQLMIITRIQFITRPLLDVEYTIEQQSMTCLEIYSLSSFASTQILFLKLIAPYIHTQWITQKYTIGVIQVTLSSHTYINNQKLALKTNLESAPQFAKVCYQSLFRLVQTIAQSSFILKLL